MEIAAYRQPSVLKRKRGLAGCEAFGVKKEAAFAVGNKSYTERAREMVRQRFQSELVAVHRLLEKAAAMARSEEPSAKRSKMASTSPAVARKMVAVEEEDEDVDILGGVSPLAIPAAPLLLAEDENEDVDICGDASPVVIPKNLCDEATISASPSSSSSSSSSDSDSDSGSYSSSSSSGDSDEDESVDSQESQAERDATLLIARAKEYQARWRARVNARQEVLETERAAMPTETIHRTVLRSLRIDEHGTYSSLRRLGLFLKADNYGIKKQQHHRRQIFQEDLEEGEIRS